MNTQISQQKRRLAGAAGVLGALLFFAGDMLFYGYLGSGAGFHEGMIVTVTNASLARLFVGGLVGPVAACLCIVGFCHVCPNVRPSAGRRRNPSRWIPESGGHHFLPSIALANVDAPGTRN